MTVSDGRAEARALGPHYQRAIKAFADEFRRVRADGKRDLISTPVPQGGWLEALLAAVVSYLCHEADVPQPPWVQGVTSPAPFFVLPARTFAMRVLLMLVSPPPFRNGGIFGPDNYLHVS